MFGQDPKTSVFLILCLSWDDVADIRSLREELQSTEIETVFQGGRWTLSGKLEFSLRP